MLGENIKQLRKDRGMTQEELAIRLNVVRQTVSKWEKGLSVPDADMLQRLAEALEVDITQLLGTPSSYTPEQTEAVVEQLARINEQLAIKNRRARRIWKIVGGILIAWVVFRLLIVVLSFAAIGHYTAVPPEDTLITTYEVEAVPVTD